MGISESILNRGIECCENICDEVDCEIESCCCKTHVVNSPKRYKSKDSIRSNESFNNSVISDK